MKLLKVLSIVAVSVIGGGTEARMVMAAMDLNIDLNMVDPNVELSKNATTHYSQWSQSTAPFAALGRRFPQIRVAGAATPVDKATEYPPLNYNPESERQTGQAKPAESKHLQKMRRPYYPQSERSAASRPPDMTRSRGSTKAPGVQYAPSTVESGQRMPYRPQYGERIPPGLPNQGVYNKGARSENYPNAPGFYGPYVPFPYSPWPYPSPPR